MKEKLRSKTREREERPERTRDRGDRGKRAVRDAVRGKGRDRDEGRKPSRRDKSGRTKFKYKRRDAGAVKKRSQQSAGMYDQMFRSDIPVFFPKAGTSYRVRIMPDTWEDSDHYGYELWVHSQVGADNQRYLCLEKHGEEGAVCPCCEEGRQLKKEGEDAAEYAIRAKKSVGYYIIDRDNEDAGPQLWRPVWMVDRDISSLSTDKRTNETLYIDDPDEGYDVEFDCKKKGKYTEITAIAIARSSTPLSDDEKTQDEWLEFIQENPIPDVLELFDDAHIAKALAGGSVKRDEDDEDDKDSRRTRAQRGKRRGRDKDDEDEDDEEDEKPRRRSLRDADKDDDSDEDEEDEDEKPRKRLKDDDELDEDDTDDEDEDEEDEDEKPRKRRRTNAGGDVDDDDDEDDEDDDEPAPRRAKTGKHRRR